METEMLTLIFVISFVILFSGIGILLILLHQRNKKKAIKSLSWLETTGTVIQSEVEIGESVFSSDDDGEQSQPMFSAAVSYIYQVDDMLYTSDRVSFGVKTSHSKAEKAEAIVAQYPEGARVSVFYDPDRHDSSVLERTAKGSGVLLIAGVIFLCIDLISLIVGIVILM